MPLSDVLSTVTPGYIGETLAITPKGANAVMDASGRLYQEIDSFYGGEDARYDWGIDPVFYLTIPLDHLTTAELETLLDLYLDSSKANGIARSFPWYHPTDEAYYTVKFNNDLSVWYNRSGRKGAGGVQLKILGNYVP
jgi:hypothetical protein